ncbi:hypothetical protein BCR44DRAFT_1436514 [Catenaria anguillulae PL171]|uniref:Uncharacterized protein n=1 Tax=Catenaria anguillulae PL171 TaxID=765915 RepID=A0A1Y2HID2_9FUNG|nr:hypothetical protein BCR44DRAFT_1436514 [Catenaria anguillulae PL171]
MCSKMDNRSHTKRSRDGRTRTCRPLINEILISVVFYHCLIDRFLMVDFFQASSGANSCARVVAAVGWGGDNARGTGGSAGGTAAHVPPCNSCWRFKRRVCLCHFLLDIACRSTKTLFKLLGHVHNRLFEHLVNPFERIGCAFHPRC